jgi:FkbM family methyltransferase
MISYAQNGEDVVLDRVFAGVENGFYIDVGACNPVEDSVTYHFYERGWRGVNVEPDPSEFERLAAARDRDVNLETAVGPGAEMVTFYPSTVRGHGTVDRMLAGDRGQTMELQVTQIPLSTIFAEHAPPGGVDFLKIDVEGAEAEVVASADWDRDRPRVVIVEAVDSAGQPVHEQWESLLLEHGYTFALFDGVNRFYFRDEDAEAVRVALAAPANVLDDWIRAREAAMLEQLRELGATAARMAETQAALVREQTTHAKTRQDLEDIRSALAAEQGTLARTQHELRDVYDSTSWRLTAPVRDASRLMRLMRRDDAA